MRNFYATLWRATLAVLLCGIIGNFGNLLRTVGIQPPFDVPEFFVRTTQFVVFFYYGFSMGKLIAKDKYETVLKTGFKG